MRLRAIASLLFTFSIFFSWSQKLSVTVQITYLEPYCGGARPSPEIELAAQTPKPFIHKTLILIYESGKTKCVKTDATGFLKLKLAPGKYRLMEQWRYYKKTPAEQSAKNMDPACLKQEWQKEIAMLTVTDNDSSVEKKTEIILYCPWAIPCLLDAARPPMPQ